MVKNFVFMQENYIYKEAKYLNIDPSRNFCCPQIVHSIRIVFSYRRPQSPSSVRFDFDSGKR